MTRLSFAVAVPLLIFWIISTANGINDVKSAGINKRSKPAVGADVEHFDPSHCITRRLPNDWQNLPVSPTPYPDLPSHDDLIIVHENLTQAQPTIKRRQQWQRKALRRGNPLSNPTQYPYCEQIRSFAFQDKSGYVRTKSAPVTESDSYYWFVWNTSHPIKVVIWRSQGTDETYWSRWYATPPGGGDTRGAVQMEGGLVSKFMRADLSLPAGIEGGVSGDIALFRISNRPPGS